MIAMRRLIPWSLFAGVMGFVIGGSYVAALQMPLPSNNTASQTSNQTNAGDSILSRFWRWTASDPLPFYTSVLALFTAVLSGSTIALWLATNRNAKIAERALTEHERPWLFLESSSVRLRDPRTATVIQNNWFIKLHFTNVGRSPAIVIDCICKIVEMSTLGKLPDYGGAFQLGLQRTIGVGETVETEETGPAPIQTNRQGAELVFFGKLVYSELNGKMHSTGFALRVAPFMPATVQYNNRNYDYYD
jgi:hypothetical protein